MALEYHRSLRHYPRAWLRDDITAGLVLSGLMIPAGMGYAKVAGLPPVSGLYATVVPLLVYAVIGPSRMLVVGPDSTLAPLIAAAVLPMAAGNDDRAVALAGLMSVLVGGFLVLSGALRLGAVTDLLSKPIRMGYLAGITVTVVVRQSSALLGSGWVFGIASLLVLLTARGLRRPVLGVVAAVAGSMVIAWLTGAADHVATVGRLPTGMPSIPVSELRWDDIASLALPAAGTAMIAFADIGVLSRAYAIRLGEKVDQSEEMAAIGVVNIAAGLTGGFAVSASASRTPVAEAAGSRTQVTGAVGAIATMVFMVAGRDLPSVLPSATLAAVVIVAISTLVEPRQIVRLARMSRTEFALAVLTLLGVPLFGVMRGLFVAVALSVAAFVHRMWRPHSAELVRVAGEKGYHDRERHPDGERVPGLVILRFDSPLFFANGSYFADVVRSAVAEAPPPVRWVGIAAEAITMLDTTAADELVALDDELAEKDIRLVFAEMKGPIKDCLDRYDLAERFGPDRRFATLGTLVSGYVTATGTRWVDWEDRA